MAAAPSAQAEASGGETRPQAIQSCWASDPHDRHQAQAAVGRLAIDVPGLENDEPHSNAGHAGAHENARNRAQAAKTM